MAADIFVRPPEMADVDLLLQNIRAADMAEIRATSPLPPAFLIKDGLRRSVESWSVFVDGEIACILGVTSPSLLGGIGNPWMIGTPLLETHRRNLVRRTPGYIATMLRLFPTLENYVHAENRASVRWLKRLGFEIHDPEPTGYRGALFHKFTMRE